MNELKITSPDFANNGLIPKRHTGFGDDISPAFNIEGISKNAVSIAIIMDDLDIPFVGAFNHWVIWNIPKTNYIEENIQDRNAVHGIGWGKNRYRGPKQPVFIHKAHRYRFEFYALDTFLDLDSSDEKKELLIAMDGHILQKGNITGTYKR